MHSVEKRKLAFLFLAAPFILNDILFVAVSGSYAVYLIDYLTRVLVLAVCFTWPVSRIIVLEPPDNSLHFGWLILSTILLVLLGATINDRVEALIFGIANLLRLYEFSYIEDDNLYLLDLTIGLFLVALSEELVFRKLALSWLREAGYPTIQIALISAFFFSLAHWGRGFGTMLSALLIGCLFMASYLVVGRLWPLVAAHWIIDFNALGPGY